MSHRTKLVYTLLASLLFISFVTIFVTHIPGGTHPVIGNQPEIAMASMNLDVHLTPEPISVKVVDGKIEFPISLLLQHKMLSFEYKSGQSPIPLLAYISPEGRLVTAVRICEPCNSTTFRIEGTELACGNCETRWKLNNLEGIQGSCQKYAPEPIPSTMVGTMVQIEERLVQNWRMRI